MYYKQYVCEVIAKSDKKVIYKTIIKALTIEEAEDFAIKDYNEHSKDDFYNPDEMTVKIKLITDWVDSNTKENA